MDPGQNNRGHKILVGIAIFATAFFIALLSKALTLDTSKLASPLVGKAAKGFQVRLLQGDEFLLGHRAESVDLADLRGSPLIINFWASWCSSCAAEAHTFEKFWREHSSEVKMLGIAVHDKSEDVMSFVGSLGKTYAIGLDEEGRAALNYGVTGVPETVFINAQGIVVHKESGPVSRALLEKYLGKIKESST